MCAVDGTHPDLLLFLVKHGRAREYLDVSMLGKRCLCSGSVYLGGEVRQDRSFILRV